MPPVPTLWAASWVSPEVGVSWGDQPSTCWSSRAWCFTRAPTTWLACSPEPRSFASHRSHRRGRRTADSCWATSATSGRPSPSRAIIGLAPVILNPLGLLFTTALLTPLTFRQVTDPSVGIVVKGIFASGFPTDAPLQAAVWAYLSLSFALGSVPSREDLSGLPLLLAVLGVGILIVGSLRIGTEGVLSSAAYDLSGLAAGLYALPAAVAAGGAIATGLLGRSSQW